MKKCLTKIFACNLVLLSLACGSKEKTDTPDPVAEDDPELRLLNEDASPLRGYKAIRQTVRERIVNDGSFELVKYLQDSNEGAEGGSILPLLGGFEGWGHNDVKSKRNPRPVEYAPVVCRRRWLSA